MVYVFTEFLADEEVVENKNISLIFLAVVIAFIMVATLVLLAAAIRFGRTYIHQSHQSPPVLTRVSPAGKANFHQNSQYIF